MIKINIPMPEGCGTCPCRRSECEDEYDICEQKWHYYCKAIKVDGYYSKELEYPYDFSRPPYCPIVVEEESEIRLEGSIIMKVSDCMKEIRKAKDAIDTLEKYKDGKMSGIAEQHIKEIETVIYAYIEMIEQCDVR